MLLKNRQGPNTASIDNIDSTALASAAKNGHVGAVELLLACGVDPNKGGSVPIDTVNTIRK